MNRRDFLKMLGVGGLIATQTKIIFDMGANLYRMQYPEHILGSLQDSGLDVLQYVKFASATRSGDIVAVSNDFTANKISTSKFIYPRKVGVAAQDVEENGYGFIQISGMFNLNVAKLIV